MYKILILKREASEMYLTNPSLWTVHMIEKTIQIDDPDGKTDPDTGLVVKVDKVIVVEFETADMTELETEVKKLLITVPKGKIKPISDLTFELDVLITP